MRRDITRLSLCIFLLLVFKTHAVPWREKTAVKFATSLPNRLIDSIMAQGNWNILFQEGPFAEFQRQIAIANHFALRGDKKPAEQYFSRADTALEIAYGSLRGKFGWPRSASGLNANDLQWGENRETFQDYLLCRLQLYLESGLAAHENGDLRFSDIEGVVSNYERQLGVPLQKKDAELDAFVRLIREGLAIRAAREQNDLIRAEKFAAASDRITGNSKNYWSRRSTWFRIFENLHYGNLGRAAALAGPMRQASPGQYDALASARILVRCSDYAGARSVAAEALGDESNQGADNYADYLRYSEILQNLAVWQRDLAAAEKIAAGTVAHLDTLLKGDQVAREEIFDVRIARENQKLRVQKLAYMNQGVCPAAAGDAAEHEIEWQVRERLFQENCGKAVDKAWWRALLQSAESSNEVKALAAQRLEGEKPAANFLERAVADEKTSELTRFFYARHRLQKALMQRGGKNLPELLVAYLLSANQLQADLLFLDWGIKLTDNLSLLALEKMPPKLGEKQAGAVFTALHRRYALESLRGAPLGYFAAPDAAQLMQHIVPALLDTAVSAKTEAPKAEFSRHDLWYADDRVYLHFESERGKLTRFGAKEDLTASWQKSSAKREALVFGNALVLGSRGSPFARLAPLYFYCAQCTFDAKLPDRLVMPGANSGAMRATKAELSDTFSTAPDLRDFAQCTAGDAVFRDTLFVAEDSADLALLPCDMRLERLVTVASPTQNTAWRQTLLAMGWRRDLFTVVLPDTFAGPERVAFLYDLFQRTNRRQMRFTEAFNEAATRAEKSFPQGAPLQSLQIYGSFN